MQIIVDLIVAARESVVVIHSEQRGNRFMLLRRVTGIAALLSITIGIPAVSRSYNHPKKMQAQEIYALAEVYGFGNGTSFLFGAGATVVCGALTAGVGGIACGLVAGA